MKSITSARFELVPTVRATTAASLSPTSFLAAIPVILSETPPITTLALVEPNAPFCCIQESLASRLKSPFTTLKRELVLRMYGHELRCDVATLDLTLADGDFFPWVRFPSVAVAILSDRRWMFESVQFVLGYESCLQHLNTTFAFRHRYLRAITSSKFDVAQQDGHELVEPSRLLEAEELLRAGVYESAVAMASAALEERLSQFLGKSRSAPINYWASDAGRKKLPKKIAYKLERIAAVRDEAVHHSTGRRVTRDDARRVVAYTRDVLRWLWLQQRGPVSQIPTPHA